MSELAIQLDYGFIENVGGNWLLGEVIKQMDGHVPHTLILSFPVPSMAWLERNKGPHLSLMTSYAVPCLLEDVLLLKDRYKCDVRIRQYNKDPSPSQ